MSAVMHAADIALRATAQPKDVTPCIATTLYDVIAAIQDAANQDDALVVATMQHLLACGRVTWRDGLSERLTVFDPQMPIWKGV